MRFTSAASSRLGVACQLAPSEVMAGHWKSTTVMRPLSRKPPVALSDALVLPVFMSLSDDLPWYDKPSVSVSVALKTAPTLAAKPVDLAAPVKSLWSEKSMRAHGAPPSAGRAAPRLPDAAVTRPPSCAPLAAMRMSRPAPTCSPAWRQWPTVASPARPRAAAHGRHPALTAPASPWLAARKVLALYSVPMPPCAKTPMPYTSGAAAAGVANGRHDIRLCRPIPAVGMPVMLLATLGPSTPMATSRRAPVPIRPSVAGFCAMAAVPWSMACDAPPMPADTGP